MVLEVCVESVRSAQSAWRGGAGRVELCSALCLGGLTPSLGLFTAVRKSVPPECPVFVMIRPHQCESYVYDESELEVMVEDVRLFKEKGANGFVFGCLNEKKEIDEKSCQKLLRTAENLPCTFHRAFDVVRNPINSLVTLAELGFSRILTSGQEKNAFSGRFLIEKLISTAKELRLPVTIVAGGGVSPENLREILESTQASEYHSSARSNVTPPHDQSNGIYETDQSVVHKMVEIGQTLAKSKDKITSELTSAH